MTSPLPSMARMSFPASSPRCKTKRTLEFGHQLQEPRHVLLVLSSSGTTRDPRFYPPAGSAGLSQGTLKLPRGLHEPDSHQTDPGCPRYDTHVSPGSRHLL